VQRVLCVFTIRNRLILGTIIAYTVAAAAHLVSVPPVAIELNTDVTVKTALAYETPSQTPRLATRTEAVQGSTQVEQRVREYFADIPVMIQVARCESGFEQFNPQTGDVFRGWMNPKDLGVMQINEAYHGATAQRLGLNLYTLEGNLAYARSLYNAQGTQPWSASRYCWGSSI
jgi:hypothetical protein